MQMREGWLLENTSAFLSQSDAVRIVYRSSITQGFIPASMAQSVQRPQQEFRAMEDSISKWKSDLEFVRGFGIDTQSKVNIGKIKYAYP